MKHPSITPLEDWSEGWLKMECAQLLNNAEFLILHDHEKKRLHYPITKEEMIDFIRHNKHD